MSDMLKEKFEELVKEQNLNLSEGDPMPTVTASVIPGEGKEPSQISDVQTSKSGGADAMPNPTVSPSVAPGQSSATDLGGTTTTPHEHDEDGEDNPGAKAAAPISQISGDPQLATKKDPGTPQFSIGTDVAYGTTTGPDVTYPIKPSFESLDVSADVAALTEGTELSEDFANKAKTIFEAAVKSKLNEEWSKLEEQHVKALAEEVEKAKSELAEEVRGTINYAISKWIEDNQVAIDRGVRNEITEDFIAGLKNLFTEHYINIPQDKEDIVEDMAENIREMETRLNEEIERNVTLNNRLAETQKQVILNKISEGLADTQKDKLASLAEGVKFESVEKFAEAVTHLKNSYFPSDAPIVREEASDSPVESISMSPIMEAYVRGISQFK